jgi:hypothetical protein
LGVGSLRFFHTPFSLREGIETRGIKFPRYHNMKCAFSPHGERIAMQMALTVSLAVAIVVLVVGVLGYLIDRSADRLE